jgi:hypothetical protein
VKDDQVKVTVSVAVAPPRAFEIFTSGIDRWWRRGMASKRRVSCA